MLSIATARFGWICVAAFGLLGATDVQAYACSCGRRHTFQQWVQEAPVVAVGQVTSVGEVPPLQVESAPNVAIVRRPFMGTGVTLAIASVAKGEIPTRQIRVWDGGSGSCANALMGLPIGTSIVIAMWPVSDTPAIERATWGAASFIPESDYFATGACGLSVQTLTSDEVASWIGRKIPLTPARTPLDDLLPSRRIDPLP